MGDLQPWSVNTDYQAYAQYIKLARDIYFNDAGFLTGSEIVKYEKEDDGDYNKRKELAFFINILKSIIDLHSNAIFSRPEPIIRNEKKLIDAGYDLSKLFVSDYGNRNQTLEYVTKMAKLQSVCCLAVTRPGLDPSTDELVSEADAKKFPIKIEVIDPLNIPDWQIMNGEFQWLKTLEIDPTSRSNPYSPGVNDFWLRVWEKDGYRIFQKKGNGILPCAVTTVDGVATFSGDYTGNWTQVSTELIPYNTEKIPVVPFWTDVARRPDSLYSSTNSWQCAKINKRILNLDSEMTEQERATTFNIFCYVTQSGNADNDLKIGAGRSCSVPPDQAFPDFVAPSATPIEILRDSHKMLIQSCFEIFRLNSDQSRGTSLSATDRVYLTDEAEKILSIISSQGEKMELAVSKLIVELQGGSQELLTDMDDPEFFSIKWPRTFNKALLSDNLVNQVISAISVQYPSKTANKAVAKFAFNNLIQTDNETNQTVMDEIDASDSGIVFNAANNQTQPRRLQQPQTDQSGLTQNEEKGN